MRPGLDGYLICQECGCASGELGRGWVAYRYDDPDDALAPATIIVYCPPCAAAEFTHRLGAADDYI